VWDTSIQIIRIPHDAAHRVGLILFLYQQKNPAGASSCGAAPSFRGQSKVV
jgi:hypothetical protein